MPALQLDVGWLGADHQHGVEICLSATTPLEE